MQTYKGSISSSEPLSVRDSPSSSTGTTMSVQVDSTSLMPVTISIDKLFTTTTIFNFYTPPQRPTYSVQLLPLNKIFKILNQPQSINFILLCLNISILRVDDLNSPKIQALFRFV